MVLISLFLKIAVILVFLLQLKPSLRNCGLRATISQDLNLGKSTVFWKPPSVIIEAKGDGHGTAREVARGREPWGHESTAALHHRLSGKAGECCAASALLVAFQACTARLWAKQRVWDNKNITPVLRGWKSRGWCLEDQQGCGWVKMSKKNLSKCWRQDLGKLVAWKQGQKS